MPTDPPYTTKWPPAGRVAMIRDALEDGGWVLSGSFDGWGEPLVAAVDLIVFLVTPTSIRMDRLRQRERESFGTRILPSGDMHQINANFAAWASKYDDPHFPGRKIGRHEAWLAEQRVPVLRLDGTRSHEMLVADVLSERSQAM